MTRRLNDQQLRGRTGFRPLLLLAASVFVSCCGPDSFAAERSDARTLRRPVAMAESRGDLFLACRDTGTIAVLNRRQLAVTGEFSVAKRLDDLTVLPGVAAASDRLLAVSIDEPRLILLERTADDIRPLAEFPVARFPVSLGVAPDGKTVSVASKWSRRVTLFRASEINPAALEPVAVVDLPFVPLKQCFLDARHLLVADAHGGGLAVVDVESGTLRSQRKLIGHNIRGLTLTPDRSRIVLTHQILTSASSTTPSIISWGGVISNTLHTIAINELLRSTSAGQAESIHGSLYPLGQEKQAAGDPGAILFDSSERAFVCLSGVSEVGSRHAGSLALQRAPVGQHPTALWLDESRGRLFVLCEFDDSVAVLNAGTLDTLHTVRVSAERLERSPIQSGEELFYNANLSLDGWFSCHSCHSDGHSTGQLNDNFSDGSFNTPKKILTLLGTGETAPWSWNGRQGFLRYQVQNSIQATMAGAGPGKELRSEQIEALLQYLRSLPAAPGILAARDELAEVAAEIERGREVFEQQHCDRCHKPPSYTSRDSYDVGLSDEAGQRQFNPPSLRGVSQRAPYFHDNRAPQLRDVLNEHNPAGAGALPEGDRAALLRFLESL